MASLSDVVKGIQSTNELLVENVKGQNRTAAMITAFVTGQQSSFGDRLEAGREKGKSTKATAQPVKGSGGGGFKSGVMKGSGLSSLLGFGSKIIGALFSGVAAAGLLTAISVAAGTAFGGLIAGGAVVGLIKLFGEGVLNKIFDIIDPNNVKFTETQKMSITQSILRNLMAGALLLFIAPKLGLAVFLGLLVKDLALSMFDETSRNKLKEKILKGEFENKFMQAFADNFTLEKIASVGSVLASFFGLSLLTGAIRQAFTGSPKGGPGGAKVKPRFGGLFRKAFGLRLGLALMLPALGTAISGQIESLTGDKDLAKIASVGINATIIAAMLGGPYAALIAALGTLTVIAFSKIRKFITDKNAKIEEDLKKAAAAADKAFIDDPNAVTRRNKKRADFNLNQELLRKSEISGGGFNAGDTLERELRSHMKLNRKNPLASDFYNEFTNELYTGNIGQSRMNPYRKGSPDFRAFQKAAQRSFDLSNAGGAEGPGGIPLGDAPSDFRPVTSLFKNALKFIRIVRDADTFAERRALQSAAAQMAATAKFLAEDRINDPRMPNNTVVVAGNQKISTVDTLYNMHGHSGFGTMSLGQRGRQTP
jgi:hypothetical protein